MDRRLSRAGAFCLALLLPALADAQGVDRPLPDADLGRRLSSRPLAAPVHAAIPGVASAAEACRSNVEAAESADSRWQWRLRAFRHLDCLGALADAALQDRRSGDGDDTDVRMPRADLERIRQLAWWARDAAARIGQ
jgi:hypothetical protein